MFSLIWTNSVCETQDRLHGTAKMEGLGAFVRLVLQKEASQLHNRAELPLLQREIGKVELFHHYADALMSVPSLHVALVLGTHERFREAFAHACGRLSWAVSRPATMAAFSFGLVVRSYISCVTCSCFSMSFCSVSMDSASSGKARSRGRAPTPVWARKSANESRAARNAVTSAAV